jgi:hypothetical protein
MRIAYDIVLDRPGCPIIQAAFGGDLHIVDRFPIQSWLLAPTENMRTYEASAEQIEVLISRQKLGVARLSDG